MLYNAVDENPHAVMRVMTSLPKCGALRDAVGGWDWVDMMVLFCKRSAAEDAKFLRRISELRQEMVMAYDDKVDFIRELEAVPNIDVAVKTARFRRRIYQTMIRGYGSCSTWRSRWG
uniref:Uncharacterized protein n=1 Tax=Tanacetum cinerariifolium TaxID=118510 RepID=A0A699JQY6_TANCI|nr:hypothetical protein [Tanacetum cinerariifolium]